MATTRATGLLQGPLLNQRSQPANSEAQKAGLPAARALALRLVTVRGQADGHAMERAATIQQGRSHPGSVRVAGRDCLGFAHWRTIAAFGLPFLLYLATLTPTVYSLDSAELTTAAATEGLLRATGYPLYLLVGRLWSQLPIGDVGFRMNLLSAFSGAMTIVFAERILRRWRVGPLAAFGALGLLAGGTAFWELSLIAEVYTPHTALMAGLILLVLRWADRPTPGRLAPIGLLAGLSLGHHAATVLLAPGAMWYAITSAPRQALKPRVLLPAGGALLLGLSVYLYLPLREAALPAFNYAGRYDATGAFRLANLSSPDGLWWLISGRAFAGQMLAYDGAELWREMQRFGVDLWRAFFAIGIGPGLLGMVVLLRRNARLGVMLLLLFATNAWFYIGYRVADKETMFLPTYLIWALWLGVGYQWLVEWVSDPDHAATNRWSMPLLHVAMVGAVLVAVMWNWRLVDHSKDWSARTYGETILREVEPDALVFGWWGTAPVLQYLQLVEGQRPDVWTINRFLISHDDLQRLIVREVARRPVYIDSPPIELSRTLEARSDGLLFRLSPVNSQPLFADEE